MWQRFPPRMRRALVAALDEAARHGRDLAEPEDLLTAISADTESAGFYLLEQCQINVQKILVDSKPSGSNGKPALRRAHQLTEPSLEVLRTAAREATRLRHEHVGTEHVVAAL